ncbi:hypothetical protein DL96DRAFT_1471677 [Flagelloscypha sp. PMI_526]|nr:hypothetical protein DL96DRAFT_1471677 [Flagelloscypha sp. PMI_526]
MQQCDSSRARLSTMANPSGCSAPVVKINHVRRWQQAHLLLFAQCKYWHAFLDCSEKFVKMVALPMSNCTYDVDEEPIPFRGMTMFSGDNNLMLFSSFNASINVPSDTNFGEAD